MGGTRRRGGCHRSSLPRGRSEGTAGSRCRTGSSSSARLLVRVKVLAGAKLLAGGDGATLAGGEDGRARRRSDRFMNVR